MTLPCRGDLHDWHRVGCAGGLGYKVHGTMPDGSLFQTGCVYYKETPCLPGSTIEIETLNWR